MGFHATMSALLLVLLLPAITLPPEQGGDTVPLTVEAGDTWAALGRRFNVDPAALQASSGHINTDRQPAIGSTLQIPVDRDEVHGAIIRTNDGGLLATATTHGTSAWALALANDLASPYVPGLWRPILIPGNETIRELPPGTLEIALNPATPVPGQALLAHIALATAGQAGAVSLDGRPFAITLIESGLIAAGGTGAFAATGEHELAIKIGNAPVWRQPWLLSSRDWIFQELTLSGEAAEIDQAAIDAERARLSSIWSQVTPRVQWVAPFQTPITNYLEVSAEYGARRSYNGGPYRAYHEGVDFSAWAGTPVTAAAGGTVVLAEPLAVRGGTVLIDHGLGIFTGYYHMSQILVAPGQVVQAGDLIGEVGTTGLSTGNHLHWDLIINGTWVDAQRWLAQDGACWLLRELGSTCNPPS